MSMKNPNDTIENRTRDLEYVRELDLILFFCKTKILPSISVVWFTARLKCSLLHVITMVIVLDL